VNPIHTRDGGKCVVHGDRAETVHHRNHDHSDDRPSNRISVCGSGTTGAHGWIEAHPAGAGVGGDGPGWTVSRHGARSPDLIIGSVRRVDTTQVPVWMEAGPYGQGWYLLDDDYGFWGWPGSLATQERGLDGG
jgi:hypothetical protein